MFASTVADWDDDDIAGLAAGLHRLREDYSRAVAEARVAQLEGAQMTATKMTHREVLEAMSGLLLGLLVAILSSTVVSAALPTIISDLHGSQSSFTWVVTATLLAMTVSTPIWGKLADLFDRKLLVQSALSLYVFGSILAGFAQSTSWLIGCRVIQGLGVGGLMALVQVVLSDLVSPRERGRYMGYLGSVMAVGTVGGPLLGGVITDSALGWRWCFFVGVPIAAAAFVVLQRTLHLPERPRRKVKIDYLGAALISAGVSAVLIWVSLAGHQFDWLSWQSAALVGAGVALLIAADPGRGHPRRAADPHPPLPRARARAGRHRQRLRGRGAVRRGRVPEPVPADLARREPDRVRPADHPDDGRASWSRRRWWAGGSARPAATRSSWSRARPC